MNRKLLTVFLLSTAACASSASESTSESTDDLATSSSVVACGEVIAGKDDAYFIYASCPASGERPEIRVGALAEDRSYVMATYEPTDEVLRKGVSGGSAWWLVRHGDGSRHLFYRPVKGATAPSKLELGASGSFIIQIAFVENAVVLVTRTEDGQHHVVVGRPDAAVAELPLIESAGDPELLMAGGELVVVAGVPREIRRLDVATASFGPAIAPELGVSRIARGSFDGSRFFAAVWTGESYAYASVETATGKVRILTGGFKSTGWTLITTGSGLWFTAEQQDGDWVLDHVSPSGATTLVATDPYGFSARLSHDGRSLFYSAGIGDGPNALGWVPSDGAAPPMTVIAKEANSKIDIVEASPRPGKLLIALRDVLTGDQRVRLLDDRTATSLGEWTYGIDYQWGLTLSGDGNALFALNPCAESTAVWGDTTLMQLWPAATTPTGCARDLANVATAPNAGAVFTTSPGAVKTVRIFRP